MPIFHLSGFIGSLFRCFGVATICARKCRGVKKNPTVFHKISLILSTPQKKHTHLRGVRNEVKLTGPSAQAPLRTDPFQTSVSRSATTCGSFCRNHKYLPATPSVLFFEATLPLKPATIALEIGHLAFQVDPSRVSNFSPQVCFWWLRGPGFRPVEDSGI